MRATFRLSVVGQVLCTLPLMLSACLVSAQTQRALLTSSGKQATTSIGTGVVSPNQKYCPPDDPLPCDPYPTNKAPVISWSVVPVSGSWFWTTDSFTIGAYASDPDGTVAKVEFLLDHQVLVNDTVAPYQASVSGLTVGTHTLGVVAWDNDGRTAQASDVTINVLTPPTGSLSASPATCNIPAGSTTCTATISWTSNRATTGIWITELDGSNLVNFSGSGGALSGSRTATWIWAGGTRFHLRENASSPDLATIEVRGNQPPNVTLTAPANGGALKAPATVAVSATASDPDGSVQRVEFWGDGALIKSVTAAPYQASWANVAAGSHTVKAIAYDNLGNSRWTDTSTIKVLSGSISASPNPCEIPIGGTTCTETVTWTSNSSTAQVWMSATDGSGAQLFASGQSGSSSASWVSATTKRLTLKSDGVAIATVDVRAIPPPVVSTSATIEYDELGRVIARNDSQNKAKAKYTYDANGNVLTATDGLGRTTTMVYDALNRVIKSTDPAGHVTQYAYDMADRVTKVIDPRNNATTYTLDGFGQLWTQVNPDTGTTTYTYGTTGLLTGMVRNDGSSLTYTYDALGRPTSVGDSQESRTYIYDTCTNGKGLLCRMTGSKAGTVHSWTNFTYTPAGWLATREDAMQSTSNLTAYSYDGTGRPIGISYPSGVSVGYAYDHGKLSAVTSTVGGVTTTIATAFHYQPFGAATEWTYGNGLKHSAGFDTDGRLTTLGVTNASTVRQNLSYTYNLGDEITAITNGVDATQNRTYAYDAAGRLWKDTRSNQEWLFDANGNQSHFTSPTWQTDYMIEPVSNRVSSYTTASGIHTSYQYDLRGNRTMAQEQPGITQSYTYNTFNRLTTVTAGTQVTSLLYNAQDQRVGKITAGGQTRYIYMGDQLEAEHGPAGWKSYLWLGSELAGVVLENGTTYFVHNDHLGRPEVATGASKEVVWQASNRPYNRTVTLDQIGGLNLGFPGQYQDVETGLWINGYRTYDDSINRYLESDPIGQKGGTNTYAYALGNPINYIDRLGLFPGEGGIPDIPSNIPGGPFSPATGQRPGTFFGPRQTSGPRVQCDYVPPAGQGGPPQSKGYWKVRTPAGNVQRYDLSGNPIAVEEAHAVPTLTEEQVEQIAILRVRMMEILDDE